MHIRLTSIPMDKHNFSVYYSSVKAFGGALVLKKKKYSCKNPALSFADCAYSSIIDALKVTFPPGCRHC